MIKLFSSRLCCCLLTCALMAVPYGVSAQDDPFGEKKKEDKKETKEKEDVPLSLQRKRENPLILSLKEHPPKTLREVMRAIKLTFDVDRPNEFKLYAAQLLALKPDLAQLTAFHEEYGGPLFWEMARRREFAPEGREIGELVLAAAAAHARDPALLAAAIAQLEDKSTRPLAMKRLLQGGPAGVVALLHAGDTAKPGANFLALQTALVALGKESVDPCIAALEADSQPLRINACVVLGKLKAMTAVPYLVGLAQGGSHDQAEKDAAREALLNMTNQLPTKPEVEAFLLKRIKNYLAGDIPAEPDAEQQIPLWQWNKKEGIAELNRFAPEDAGLIVANRLASYLGRIAPENPAYVRLSLIVRLEAERNLLGLDVPLSAGSEATRKLLAATGVDRLQDLLQEALENRRFAAAASVAEMLGEIGKPELLTGHAGQESVLVTALNCPDQRTQYAALRAILTLADGNDFPGSSRVMETAAYLLTGTGTPRVLIGHSRTTDATRIATLFTELGYAADHASNGSQLARLAKQHADYELIFLSDTLDRPSLLETTQMLRHDIRSAWIPLGIMRQDAERNGAYWNDPLIVETGNLLGGLNSRNAWTPQGTIRARGADLAKDADRFALVVAPPLTAETARWQASLIAKLAGRRMVPAEVRAEHASLVLADLLKLLSAKQPPKYFDYQRLEGVLKLASEKPLFTPQAMQALGYLGSPSAQLFLVEQASLIGRAEADRKAAVEGFALAVSKRGLLLTQTRLQQQYDLYNARAELHADSATLLNELLDVIETPRKQRLAAEKE